MNFLVNLVVKHIIAAIEQGWKTTAMGCIVAAIAALEAIVPTIQGHPIDQVNWGSVLGKVFAAIGLVLAKDITIEKVITSAPRAEPVEPILKDGK